MRTISKTAAGTAAVAVALLLAAPALYAHETTDRWQHPMAGPTMMHGGSMMGGMTGMMGHMHQMKGHMEQMSQMSQMFSACDEMMKGAATETPPDSQNPG